MTQLRIGYIGNFGPVHSTENHVRQALEGLGHQVVQFQEDDPVSWDRLLDPFTERLDVVLWTRTWHLPQFRQLDALAALKAAGWRIKGIAVLGQNSGGVRATNLRQYPQAPTAPINVTAREVRAQFGWL